MLSRASLRLILGLQLAASIPAAALRWGRHANSKSIDEAIYRMVYFTFPLQLKGTCLPQKNMFCPRFSILYMVSINYMLLKTGWMVGKVCVLCALLCLWSWWKNTKDVKGKHPKSGKWFAPYIFSLVSIVSGTNPSAIASVASQTLETKQHASPCESYHLNDQKFRSMIKIVLGWSKKIK